MNFFREDPHFQLVIRRYLQGEFLHWADKELDEFGELCANKLDERARHTDREGQPKLIKYDRYGEDISEVWLNEGYKQTVEEVYNRGIVGYVHKEIPALKHKGNYMYSFSQGYLLSQAEAGFHCPVTLTAATAYLLDKYGSDELKEQFLPHVISTGEIERYEGATFLTERQGGSDVGANETKAIFDGEHYRLYGEKYFASNAGACGVATVLARKEGAPKGTKGLSLFLVPWRNEDGSLNGIQIRRLKDKLGVRAVPSGEVVFDGAKAFVIGDASKGFYYMMEALNLSRVCNAVASIGIMRRALAEAKKYSFHRNTFGAQLASFPMVRETLTKMTLKQEVETRAVFQLIALFDRISAENVITTEEEKVMNRLLIALLKLETAEQAIHFSHEAIELHGGNGYIEDFVTPRLLRDAQVLTVWEGTANVLGLEVLRLMKKYNGHELFIREVRQRLSSLPKGLQDLSNPVKTGLDQLEKMSEYVLSADEDAQSYHCKRIARTMIKIFESTIALEEAVKGGNREELAARLFIKMEWENPNSIDVNLDFAASFEEIVLYKKQDVKVEQM
jgi:alkylation response protein AidB-like acyl-CoA dehydrogenase